LAALKDEDEDSVVEIGDCGKVGELIWSGVVMEMLTN